MIQATQDPSVQTPDSLITATDAEKAPVLDHDAQVKSALGWLHTARFLTTAAQLHHLPSYALPEIAFVGRSNAGKSTCINTLTQQKRLAFASKTMCSTGHLWSKIWLLCMNGNLIWPSVQPPSFKPPKS